MRSAMLSLCLALRSSCFLSAAEAAAVVGRTTDNLAVGSAASLRPNRRTYGAGSPAAGLGAVPGAAPTLMPLMHTGSSKRTCARGPGTASALWTGHVRSFKFATGYHMESCMFQGADQLPAGTET